MSNINVNNSGNMTGVAIDDGAQVTVDKIGTINAVSETVGKVIRSAAALAGLFP